MLKKFAVATTALLMLTACTGETTGMSKKEIERIVAEYIANNGGALVDAIDAHMAAEQLAAAEAIVRDHNMVLANPNGEVTLVEFGNFRCPFCKRVQPTLQEVQNKYPGKVKHVFKHMPIDPTSSAAALALQAAHNLGKGSAFFNAMWDESELVDATFERVAGDVGLNVEAFNKERASEKVRAQVEQDVADARTVGGSGTPHFVINGVGLSGAQPIGAFSALIDAALAE